MRSVRIIKDYLLHCSLLLFAFGFFGLVVDNNLFGRVALPYGLISGLRIGALALPKHIDDCFLVGR